MEDEPTFNPLYEAVLGGDLSLVRSLIAKGARVTWEPSPFDESPLHAAAQLGHANILRLLIETGGRSYLNAFAGIGHTPLIEAVRSRQVDAVKVLLEAGADVDANDESEIGDTAIHHAVAKGYEEIVELLLAAGADPNIRGWMQHNAVDEAYHRFEKLRDAESERILKLVERAAKNFPERPVEHS